MSGVFSFIYSRPFRFVLTMVEALAVVAAILFVVSLDFITVGKLALFACIAVSTWEVGLALSLYIMTKDSIDKVITIMMRTTRKFSLRPYVFAIDMFVYLLAAWYVVSHSPNMLLTTLSLLLVFALIWDKMNSLYMSFIITQIADKEAEGKDSKKHPKNPLQK